MLGALAETVPSSWCPPMVSAGPQSWVGSVGRVEDECGRCRTEHLGERDGEAEAKTSPAT